MEQPYLVPRSAHELSRKQISQAALRVLYGLKDAGFQAYLVGGGVRDLLLGREPKDFDVVTDARPEEVRRIFRNARLIGRRFILVHVYFQQEIIEVATFRCGNQQADVEDTLDPDEALDEVEGWADAMVQDENGRLLADNLYGNLEDDIFRRDFTVNALYYNIADFSILDRVGGLEDLRAGRLRVIGEPEVRYREDPVRMLRAIRFAAKLGFRLAPETEAPLQSLGHLLHEVPPARLFDESLKLFLAGHAVESYEWLRQHDLFQYLFPATERALSREHEHFPLILLHKALENTDARIAEGKPVTPAFLFAALLWEPVRLEADTLVQQGMPEAVALQQAASQVVQEQTRHIAIPKRFSVPMREIWDLQSRFQQRRGRRPFSLLAHPRFRAAYDFLLLRVAAGEVAEELGAWWTEFQDASNERKMTLVREAPVAPAPTTPGAEGVEGEPVTRGPRRRRRRTTKRKDVAQP
ncbi:polynucleotide adenylyltransferase PcnB [Thermithiobacillus plumbiphilus]|uniref:Poly(A) polymerase I n=1 Tax=Thermithiobacillus plumbiphilus TaxID=1729899 RepID=A0ABU9DCY2_9PROT